MREGKRVAQIFNMLLLTTASGWSAILGIGWLRALAKCPQQGGQHIPYQGVKVILGGIQEGGCYLLLLKLHQQDIGNLMQAGISTPHTSLLHSQHLERQM
jgi:hypothetical protein